MKLALLRIKIKEKIEKKEQKKKNPRKKKNIDTSLEMKQSSFPTDLVIYNRQLKKMIFLMFLPCYL